MAIEFNCPYCDFSYQGRHALRDEFAGKKATCKNPMCRKVITIPQPTANGPPRVAPGAPPIDVEAAALSALADAPAEEAGPKTIPMVCTFCEHKWTEPIEKAGKNVLCPNPECRQRQKVPVPKDHTPQDWRGERKGPSLAKENFEKPTDVQDMADAKLVSGEALKKAGVSNEEIEPLPLRTKVLFVLVPFLLVCGIGFGIYYWWGARTNKSLHNLMAQALKEWEESDDGSKPPPPEVPLFATILHLSAGEYAIRDAQNHNDPKKLRQESLAEFTKARDAISRASTKDPSRVAVAERNAVLAELAAATLLLGGTDEQVKAETRFRWLPEAPGGRQLRVNEKVVTVHAELGRTLDLLRPAESDFRTALARRLARELVKRGQAAFAAETLPAMLFDGNELPEARAVVALEIYRLDKGSAQVRAIAEDLKRQVSGKASQAPSATTLWRVLEMGKDAPALSPPSGSMSEAQCLAYTGLYLLQDNPDEALKLARAAVPQTQLRAYALCAEWSNDPSAAVTSAAALVGALRKDKGVSLPQSVVLRLSQRAAEAGKAEEAKALADALSDEGLRAWARGDAVRLRLASASKEPADEAAAEVPDDPRNLRAGHAWARLAVARQNARVSGARDDKAVAGWPRSVRPFGLAGIALGLQDRDVGP